MKPVWKFERNEIDESEGPNDSGISSFTGDRAGGLVREALQNSIDARRFDDEPVEVSFEIVEIPVDDFDIDGLMRSLKAACDSDDNDERHRKQFKRGLRVLEAAQKSGSISALMITDSNTTGASDKDGRKDKWRSLTRAKGKSTKDKKDAGGSFGIGKNAAFTAADMRTVLYSTAYYDNGSLERRYTGKSILVSHEIGDDRFKATGYLLGSKTDRFVPESFQLEEPGTRIAILGFPTSKRRLGEWRKEAYASMAGSFFHALAQRGLMVSILGEIYDHANIYEVVNEVQDDKKLKQLLEVSRSEIVTHTDITGIGRVNLRILVDEEDSRDKVLAIVRDSGMLITDRLGSMRTSRTQPMVSFPRPWYGFVAVVECLSQYSNPKSLLREAEGPRHNEISPDNADEDERSDVRQAIRTLGRWIRQEIEKLAKPPPPARSENASEVADFLPLPGEGAPSQSARGLGNVEISQPLLREVLPSGLGLPGRVRRGSDSRPGGQGGGEGGRRNLQRKRRKGRGRQGSRAVETVFQDVRRLPSKLERWPEHTAKFALDMPEEMPKRIRLFAVGEDRKSEQLRIERAYFGGRRLKVTKGEIAELEPMLMKGKRVEIEIKAIRPLGSKRLELKAA